MATWIRLAPGLCVASEASAALGSISTLVPIPLTGIVVHTEGYTHAAKVPNPHVTIRTFCIAVGRESGRTTGSLPVRSFENTRSPS